MELGQAKKSLFKSPFLPPALAVAQNNANQKASSMQSRITENEFSSQDSAFPSEKSFPALSVDLVPVFDTSADEDSFEKHREISRHKKNEHSTRMAGSHSGRASILVGSKRPPSTSATISLSKKRKVDAERKGASCWR